MTRLPSIAAVWITFVVLDAAWLLLVAAGMFQRQLGPILREHPDYVAVAAFYLVYPVGLYVLAVRPALAERNVISALALGAVTGCIAYATFELTAVAIIKGWTWSLVVVDVGWGTLVSAVAALMGYLVGRRGAPATAVRS